MRQITIDGITYPSVKSAAHTLGVSVGVMYACTRNGLTFDPAEYLRSVMADLKQREQDLQREQELQKERAIMEAACVVTIDGVDYTKWSAAAFAFGVSIPTLRKQIANGEHPHPVQRGRPLGSRNGSASKRSNKKPLRLVTSGRTILGQVGREIICVNKINAI
jgi:hypothetical protein